MNKHRVTTSAAFFFRRHERTIPVEWLERVSAVLTRYNLSPVLFTARDSDALSDDCYVLADRGSDLVLWDELRLARRAELVDAMRSAMIRRIWIDVPQPDARSRFDWRANASAADGHCFLGLEANNLSDPAAAIRSGYSIAGDLFDICYGIAYQMPLAMHPECYARGSFPFTGSPKELIAEMRAKHDGTYKKTSDDIWADELKGQQRHLTGLFRGAYPASILSEAHLETGGLKAGGIGKLSRLGNSLWLWELSDVEIPEAEKMLESRGALVRQAAQ